MSAPPRILVVEHEPDAGAGLFGERMAAAGATHDTVGPERGVPIPATADGYDGVLVLGGTPGPVDDEVAPWLPAVRRLIRTCLDHEVPLLGLCLGGQLLAHVAGGRVAPAQLGAEVGVLPLELTDAAHLDPLFSAVVDKAVDTEQSLPIRSIQWHLLEVADLPPGSVPLMRSERCPVQAFRVGRCAWGTQFHPEAGAGTVRDWAADDADTLERLGLDAVTLLAEAAAADDELRATWGRLADRWLQLCARPTPP